MLRKVAAVGMLALSCLATGCWFNAPCCSPYDRASPTFGDDPSVPNDFNYRKGSILGSDTSAGEYIDDGVEYVPDDGAVSDYVDEQPQPVARYTPQPRRFPGPTRAAYPMIQGATYQGTRSQDGYQGADDQGGDDSRTGFQGASSYRTGTNPRYQPLPDEEEFEQDETEVTEE